MSRCIYGAQRWSAGNNKGKFEVHTIDNLSMAKKGSCHINFNTGNAVYSTISIFIVDYRNNKEAEAILKYSKEER